MEVFYEFLSINMRLLILLLVVLASVGFFEKREKNTYCFLTKRFLIVMGALFFLNLSASFFLVAGINLHLSKASIGATKALNLNTFKQEYVVNGLLQILPDEVARQKILCYRAALSHFIEDRWNKPFNNGICKQEIPSVGDGKRFSDDRLLNLCPKKLPDTIHSHEDFLEHVSARLNPRHSIYTDLLKTIEKQHDSVWVMAADLFGFMNRLFRIPARDGVMPSPLSETDIKEYHSYLDQCTSYTPVDWATTMGTWFKSPFHIVWGLPVLGGLPHQPEDPHISWYQITTPWAFWPLPALLLAAFLTYRLLQTPRWEQFAYTCKWGSRFVKCLILVPVMWFLASSSEMLFNGIQGRTVLGKPNASSTAIKMGVLDAYTINQLESESQSEKKGNIQCLSSLLRQLAEMRVVACREDEVCVAAIPPLDKKDVRDYIQQTRSYPTANTEVLDLCKGIDLDTLLK